MSDPTSVKQFLQTLPIPWLYGGPVGQLDAQAMGNVVDAQIALLKEAAKAHYADYGPSDALKAIGGDRQLIQGVAETDANFRIRIRDWGQFARAGTFVGLLEQLYYSCGIQPLGCVIMQQNGTYWQLGSAPTPGVDPTSLVTNGACDVLAVALHSSVTLSRSIPAGNSWWTQDSNTDLCSRFWILTQNTALATMFYTRARATFTGTEDGSTANPWPLATWPNLFPDTSYAILPGAPVVADLTSGGAVTVTADLTTQTTTGVRITASGPFTGYVDVLAYQQGANPFADPHPADLARLRAVINTWRPAKAPCVSINVLVRGKFIGWPVRTIGSVAPSVGAQVISFSGGY